jgi:hypothetical protein
MNLKKYRLKIWSDSSQDYRQVFLNTVRNLSFSYKEKEYLNCYVTTILQDGLQITVNNLVTYTINSLISSFIQSSYVSEYWDHVIILHITIHFRTLFWKPIADCICPSLCPSVYPSWVIQQAKYIRHRKFLNVNFFTYNNLSVQKITEDKRQWVTSRLITFNTWFDIAVICAIPPCCFVQRYQRPTVGISKHFSLNTVLNLNEKLIKKQKFFKNNIENIKKINLGGSGIESQWVEIFRIRLHPPWDPISLV